MRIFYKYFSAAPGSITVSVAYTGFGTGNCELVTPIVFSGAHWDQTGAAVASASPAASTDGTVTITTTRPGSYVWGVSEDEDTLASWTANGNTLLAQEFTDVTNAIRLLSFAASSLTVTPGPLVVGGTYGAADATNTAAFEVLPAPELGYKQTSQHPGRGPGYARFYQTPRHTVPPLAVDIELAEEFDTANAVTPAKSLSMGQALETDAASGITPTKAGAIGRALETDTANAITPVKSLAIGQALEVDTAGIIEPITVDLIGQAVETDTANSITPVKSLVIGQAFELDTANSFTRGLGVGAAVESDTAFDITVRKTTVFRLVHPVARKGHPLDQTGIRDRGPTFSIPIALTVYGSGGTLQYGETPPGHILEAAEYVWYGGYENLTDDPEIRALWLANGFEVENVS